MITKMPAVEYNLLLTLIALFDAEIKTDRINGTYALTSPMTVLPSYPRDLSKLVKPSIIIRKVNTDSQPVGMGGVLGQYYDADTDSLLDVQGKYHNFTVQVDIVTDGNQELELITSAIGEGILDYTIFKNSGRITLYNYIDLNNIHEIGTCKLRNEISITNVEESSLNHEYVSAIRFDIDIIQAIVDETQELVDLTKWIKVGYKIN